MFDNCQYLKSIDLSNFDTSKVTDMGGIFVGCEKLTSLESIYN
jgi:surface protein